MKNEIEAKFIRQDHNKIRDILRELGAECTMPERTMRRSNHDYPDDRLANEHQGWVRVRDEGDKITLSYKQSDDASITGMQEVTLSVDSFEEAEAFLRAVGITKKKAYQETKRESWLLDGVAVELDTWPWIPPYVEIEAPTEEALKGVAKKLGLDMDSALFGSVIPAYKAEYDITDEEMANWPEYLLDTPVPDFFATRRKK